MSNNAPFTNLRYAYIRAIAHAWITDTVDDLVNLGASTLQHLESTYGFDFPFRVDLRLRHDEGPNWSECDNQWKWRWPPLPTSPPCEGGPSEDEYTIWLPKTPSPNGGDNVQILADYCHEFPSMLGKSTVPNAQTPDDFTEFGLITVRLIAKTWSDPNFSIALFGTSRTPEQMTQLINNFNLALDHPSYKCPWAFNMRFEQYDTAMNPSSPDYWTSYPRTRITLAFPHKPDQDVLPVALAAYNATGRQYPFSCG